MSCCARSSSSGTRWAVRRNGSTRAAPPLIGRAATIAPPTSATTCRPVDAGRSWSVARRASASASCARPSRSITDSVGAGGVEPALPAVMLVPELPVEVALSVLHHRLVEEVRIHHLSAPSTPRPARDRAARERCPPPAMISCAGMPTRFRVLANRLGAAGLVDADGAEGAVCLVEDVAADPADVVRHLVALGGRSRRCRLEIVARRPRGAAENHVVSAWCSCRCDCHRFDSTSGAAAAPRCDCLGLRAGPTYLGR